MDDGANRTDRRPSPRRSLATAGALAAVFTMLTVLVAIDVANPPILGGIDRAWRDIALDMPAWVERASEALKTLGSGVVMVPLRLAVAGWLLVRRRHAELAAWLLGWVVADALTFALKPGIGRLRPDGFDSTSFPSAHAKTAAQVAIGLVLLARDTWPTRRLALAAAQGAAAAWIVGMDVSRTVLNEHWLSDVVAGSMLGAACALGAVGLVGVLMAARADDG